MDTKKELTTFQKIKSKHAVVVLGLIFLLSMFLLLSGKKNSVDCANLSIEMCQTHVECQILTSQVDKQTCVRLTEDMINQKNEDRSLCESTDGVYTQTPYGHYCNCSLTAKPSLYQVDKGCVPRG